jgi:hypothetical protein
MPYQEERKTLVLVNNKVPVPVTKLMYPRSAVEKMISLTSSEIPILELG